MRKICFEWDKKKEAANRWNHQVSFDEAKTIFHDENHSFEESRFLMIGLSSKLRILLVSYTVMEQKDKDIIRIISSRKATKNEKRVYFERLS